MRHKGTNVFSYNRIKHTCNSIFHDLMEIFILINLIIELKTLPLSYNKKQSI